MAELRNSIDVADCSLINLANISYQLLQMQPVKLPSKLQQVSESGLHIFDSASSLTAYLVIFSKNFTYQSWYRFNHSYVAAILLRSDIFGLSPFSLRKKRPWRTDNILKTFKFDKRYSFQCRKVASDFLPDCFSLLFRIENQGVAMSLKIIKK